MRDAIARFDLCSYLAVTVFLYVVAGQVARHFPRHAPAMAWTAVTGLLGVGTWGYVAVRPTRPMEVIAILVVAAIGAAASALGTAVLLPPLVSLWEGWRAMVGRQADAARRRREEGQRLRDEQERAEREHQWIEAERLRRESAPPAPPRPPPPTKEALAAAAREWYEATLRILDETLTDETERAAGRDLAKQKLLRELERIMS